MSVLEAKRLKDVQKENTLLNKTFAKRELENEVIKDALRKMW
jgi:hypothetical protein